MICPPSFGAARRIMIRSRVTVIAMLQAPGGSRQSMRARRERPRSSRAPENRDELTASHVWMAPAWQEIFGRAAQRSLAVMCPASHDGFSVKG
jgi:hypothetical protein